MPRSWILPLPFLALLLFVGCGAPLAGRWHGTFDHGPVAAHPLALQMQDDGQKGTLDVREKGKDFDHFTVCSVEVTPDRHVTLTYDANRPNCDTGAQNRVPSELRTLKGQVGDSVFYGDVLRGAENLGFFRIFRDAEHLPGDVTGS